MRPRTERLQGLLHGIHHERNRICVVREREVQACKQTIFRRKPLVARAECKPVAAHKANLKPLRQQVVQAWNLLQGCEGCWKVTQRHAVSGLHQPTVGQRLANAKVRRQARHSVCGNRQHRDICFEGIQQLRVRGPVCGSALAQGPCNALPYQHLQSPVADVDPQGDAVCGRHHPVPFLHEQRQRDLLVGPLPNTIERDAPHRELRDHAKQAKVQEVRRVGEDPDRPTTGDHRHVHHYVREHSLAQAGAVHAGEHRPRDGRAQRGRRDVQREAELFELLHEALEGAAGFHFARPGCSAFGHRQNLVHCLGQVQHHTFRRTSASFEHHRPGGIRERTTCTNNMDSACASDTADDVLDILRLTHLSSPLSGLAPILPEWRFRDPRRARCA
mmetsp:Transcript_30396/g.83744  ORF Transcript_30396/g.83744 Transcript_30396/m.83744 type:complete len:388 (+) Transcript_30396:372-1535(+)